MATITSEELDIFKRRWLPSDAQDNGWDDTKITDEWAGSYVGTVRAYWYDRVQQTAAYLDLSDPSGNLPITQLHRQAKDMLAYWDAYIAKHGLNPPPLPNGVSFGKIKRRYAKPDGYPAPLSGLDSNGPYGQV